MQELLDDALTAGAMGLSCNQLDYDKNERPLPSQRADDAEFAALLDVVARHPGATFQVIVDHFMRMTGPAQVERMGRLAKAAGVRMQWAGLPTLKFQAKVREPLRPSCTNSSKSVEKASISGPASTMSHRPR